MGELNATQVHLVHKLAYMQRVESKSVVEHLSTLTSTLSQLRDFGLPSFNGMLKAIFLLMTNSQQRTV